MWEVIAVSAGILAGLALHRIEPAVLALISAALTGALAGAAVTVISGEIEISAGFLAFDVGQAAVAGVLTAVAARAVQRARTS